MELQPGQACSPSRGRTTMLHSICRLAVGEPGETPPTHTWTAICPTPSINQWPHLLWGKINDHILLIQSWKNGLNFKDDALSPQQLYPIRCFYGYKSYMCKGLGSSSGWSTLQPQGRQRPGRLTFLSNFQKTRKMASFKKIYFLSNKLYI